MAKKHPTSTSGRATVVRHMAEKTLPRNTCNYCKRPINTTIIANNAVYCSKLCAAMGLIAEVDKEDDICIDTFDVCFENLLSRYFHEGPIPIPVKVRWSDAADVEELDASAPEGACFAVIPIDDEQGTPDWIPPRGKQLIVAQAEIDRVVDDLLRNGDSPEEGRP
jgi:hypothetical protein